jgi:hypothetical protein
LFAPYSVAIAIKMLAITWIAASNRRSAGRSGLIAIGELAPGIS